MKAGRNVQYYSFETFLEQILVAGVPCSIYLCANQSMKETNTEVFLNDKPVISFRLNRFVCYR